MCPFRVVVHASSRNKLRLFLNSIGYYVNGLLIVLRGQSGGAQPDYQPIGQAGDGKNGIAEKALTDAELVGTVRRDNADASGADFHLVFAAV